MSFDISVPSGESKRLKTGGKYCPADILVTAKKPDSVVEKDVNFYDYDGTLLYSYTLEEAQELAELPPLPTQERLVCQGWNWSLDEIKANGCIADVGAVYITDDGKTRAIVEITDLSRPMIYLNYSGATVNIDWGDGTDVDANVAAGNHQHQYVAVGEYEITLEVVSGSLDPTYNSLSVAFIGNSLTGERSKLKRVHFGNNVSPNFGWLGFVSCYGIEAITIPEGATKIAGTMASNARRLRHINLPKSVTGVDPNAFQYCRSLSTVSLPGSVKEIGNSAFVSTATLKRCVIPNSAQTIGDELVADSQVRSFFLPDGITTIPSRFAYSCGALVRFDIPNGVTSIGGSAFQECICLPEITIPNTVTTIGSSAFAGCEFLGKIRFLSTTPPTVSNANAFTGIPTDCVVEVPADSLTAYQEATNYSSIAAQMVGV